MALQARLYCVRIAALAAVTALCSGPAWAQTEPAKVVITGNPLRSAEVAIPSSVLSGDGLVQRRGSSLGETLDGLPGVSSTGFGPNANRPVIRGQDGDRIRMLSNAGASLDASSLSFDHAVPMDPLVVERVEVLRGPAALLYGGSAVGGVVNAIDNRIPKSALGAPAGAVEARVGGGAGERAVSALVEGGAGGLAWHADAFNRRTSDLTVPAFERPLPEGGTQRRTRVANSASSAQGGALGVSLVGERGFLGASADTYRNHYGIVVEDDITIRMRRDKFAMAGEWRPASGVWEAVRGQASSSDYRHQEVEGSGAIGTTFKTRGADARLELVHRAWQRTWGKVDGLVGLQWESADFSALGEEAFVPSTHTRQGAVFLLARTTWREGATFSAGWRSESVQVRSQGDEGADAVRFGPPAERRFAPRSASLGGVMPLATGWQALANFSATERAPTSYELFANGVHAATASFERGNPQQALERGRSLDLGLAWTRGDEQIKVTVFDNRFSRYVTLTATGEPDFVNDDGQAYPVYEFRGTQARLFGLEAEGRWRLVSAPAVLDLDAKLDFVRGQDLTRGQPLPRLAPLRATVGLSLARAGWTARLEVQHAAEQTRVPAGDVPTAGSTLLNLWGSVAINLGARDALLFAKIQNLGNALAYSASAVSTVRTLSPLPGRALSLGLRVAF